MNNSHYSPSEDNVALNAKNQGINANLDLDEQKAARYPSIDNLQNATINDNFIYLSTTDHQHACYEAGEFASKDKHTDFSGYFTSEDTALNRINPDGTFDAYGFHRDVCVQPTIYATESRELMDKRHLDCFYVDRDRMEQIYGTRDFNAAIGKCNANNQYGSDGGDQGYNAALTELYNNGCLKYAGTYDADPASTLRCREELGKMQEARQEKCSAILSGASSEDVQKIGYPLDERCHQKTAFNSEPIDNLQEKYKNHQTTYNQKLADSTTNEDRLFNRSMNNAPEQKSIADGTAATNKLPEKQAESGHVTLSEIPQTTNPKQNVGTEPMGAKSGDLTDMQSPKTADQPSSDGPSSRLRNFDNRIEREGTLSKRADKINQMEAGGKKDEAISAWNRDARYLDSRMAGGQDYLNKRIAHHEKTMSSYPAGSLEYNRAAENKALCENCNIRLGESRQNLQAQYANLNGGASMPAESKKQPESRKMSENPQTVTAKPAEQKNLVDGTAATKKLPEKQAEGGPITLSEIPQPPNPKQAGAPEPVGAKKEDFPEIKSPKTADQPSAGPENPSQITPIENSTTLKNLSGNKDPNVNPENEAVSAATKAAGGMHNG